MTMNLLGHHGARQDNRKNGPSPTHHDSALLCKNLPSERGTRHVSTLALSRLRQILAIVAFYRRLPFAAHRLFSDTPFAFCRGFWQLDAQPGPLTAIARGRLIVAQQIPLPLSPVRNSGLLSSHWLEHRLALEPEWDELQDQARAVLEQLGKLWTVQHLRVEQYSNEAQLEHAFIQPVLETLGWKPIYQTFLSARKPDYALFLSDDRLQNALEAGPNTPDFWNHATIVADAKAWRVSLDHRTVIQNKREFPPEQIEWYLDRSRVDFGILTNGRLWRLVPRVHQPHQRRFQTYLECDLPALLESWRSKKILIDEFLEFFLFFSPAGFASPRGLKPLIERAIEGSSEYRVGVGESLKRRAFRALELCIEGFLNLPENNLSAGDQMARCREQSFVLLYRLLFIMFAEDRRLLPYRINDTYTKNRSLARYRDEVAERLDLAKVRPEADYPADKCSLWTDLLDLFDLVDRGHGRYGVPAYNGGLFDPEVHSFLAEKKLADYYVARIIDQLGRAVDPDNDAAGLFRVDYRDLAIQHLGSIYEGLLELNPRHAAERMVVVAARVKGKLEEDIVPAEGPIPFGWMPTDVEYGRGSVFLKTNKGERRSTGSYYTPDHIVDYIVDRTLGPLCREVHERLESEIAAADAAGDTAEAERLRRDFDDRILALRVLDPAMGSGHFLIRACQYLGEELATNPLSSDAALNSSADDESALSFWKRRVAESCLYGVDLNPLAVELAKLALWLETVASQRPLTFLDHHLWAGNSLIGARVDSLGSLPDEPFVRARADAVAGQVRDQVPALLGILSEIHATPSETVEQIKRKERLYASLKASRRPFLQLADVWCSAFVDASGVDESQYQQLVEALSQPRRFAALTQTAWCKAALDRSARPDVLPFHWELAFLEAYWRGTSRRADAGFDAVIGNPPYDILSEAENKTDLTVQRAFIDHEPIFAPSKVGKNNLYKLFICRALDLLATGGRMGFITPMALLGDLTASGVRHQIVKSAAFTSIEAFPQKDDPGNRVFPDAKLSTVVFTLVKRPDAAYGFSSRIHPGRTIEVDSPSLSLATADIPQYDPTNLTVVSCDQADWNLATRILKSGRMQRLSKFAEFFQGEVNETNARRDGVLTDDPEIGTLVTRGASICLYVPRQASQGDDLYLDVDKFLANKSADSKAFHHRYRRIGLQESSPQNNFRRVIACLVPAEHFFNHTVNYCCEPHCKVELHLLLALLNSKLADWYFRLGSTNAHVSHYQLCNLPFPSFTETVKRKGRVPPTAPTEHVVGGRLTEAFNLLEPHLKDAPFPSVVRDAMIAAVARIIAIETLRGEIRRAERSALDEGAQPYQDFIDRLFFRMAGLSDAEARGLEERLAQMK